LGFNAETPDEPRSRSRVWLHPSRAHRQTSVGCSRT